MLLGLCPCQLHSALEIILSVLAVTLTDRAHYKGIYATYLIKQLHHTI